ncbi:MAG TPA: transcription termination/antitermination NusG family protein [Candidatus Methylacidiphilales bacterium]|jgi:transcriptional antiterminator RfaH|nr:transcription termination/antitermination NusG family protein [Candidatus Methylacidiphilales bacterium]
MSLVLEYIPADRRLAAENKSVEWFCLRTHPKHEHLAAAHLRKMDQVEVFLPRIRFKRATRQAFVWVTEALFPGYLFARFDWNLRLRQVHHARGVRDIVHFGQNWPVISKNTIHELQETMGMNELHTISQEFSPGDAVHCADGSLRGLHAIVSRVMPGRKRVEVLMDLLGRQTEIELTIGSLIKEGDARAGLFRG